MLRLRKCLKGKALKAVRCRLLHPSNVNGVISTLKMLYGRPEAIIQASIRKIRTLPSPQVEKLETVVNGKALRSVASWIKVGLGKVFSKYSSIQFTGF